MKKSNVLLFLFLLVTASSAFAQEESAADPAKGSDVAAEQPAPETSSLETQASDVPAAEKSDASGDPDVTGKAKELAAETQAKVEQLAEDFDTNETAKKASEGLLGPIYILAESLSFSAFHWLAFGLMAAGVVSFALQLVLGKLVVLFKGSINVREILSDLIGLIISVLGLVLTTQAAAENSAFTHSPTAVLSATAFGAVIGFTLYWWGQAQEVNAVTGQRAVKVPKK